MYSIKDLERLSGIKAHTIRIWEKRYNLLCPLRSETNIRKYSDEELKKILNVKILIDRGYRISDIADTSPTKINSIIKKHLDDSETISAFQELIIPLKEFDRIEIEKIIEKNINRLGVEKAFTEVLFPFLKNIGTLWQTGTIEPTEEHFLSNILRHKILSLTDNTTIIRSKKCECILYLPAYEMHELALLLANYSLRSRGVNTIYLGQNVPEKNLITTIKKINPKVVITVVTIAMKQGTVEHFKKISSTNKKLHVLFSGEQIIREKTSENKQCKRFADLNELLVLLKSSGLNITTN